MCGIFAYLNYLEPKTRREILTCLVQGLKRLEYRGYDSAGVAIDETLNNNNCIRIIRRQGKVAMLEDEIWSGESGAINFDLEQRLSCHAGIAHTRWATHGAPSAVNSHPQRSDSDNEFVVVHNGIITNYKDLKQFLEKKGYEFESETDTEVIAKLIKHLHETLPTLSFREIVEQAIQQLEGAFALVFKSSKFPNQVVATRRGSPLLVGIKTKMNLPSDHIPVIVGRKSYNDDDSLLSASNLLSSTGRKGANSRQTLFSSCNQASRDDMETADIGTPFSSTKASGPCFNSPAKMPSECI